MTPEFWNAALAPTVGWREAYGTVVREAKAILMDQKVPISTGDLVEILYPEAEAKTPQAEKARQRIFKALQGASEHGLKGWWTHSEPEKLRHLGAFVKRKRWHQPQIAPACCPHCGGELNNQ